MQGAGVFGPRQPTAGGGMVKDGAGDRFTLRGGSAVLDTVRTVLVLVVLFGGDGVAVATVAVTVVDRCTLRRITAVLDAVRTEVTCCYYCFLWW